MLPGVTAGTYTIAVAAPAGSAPAAALPATVGATDSTGNDFALTRPGAIAGAVTTEGTGEPVDGVAIGLIGGGPPIQTTTDAEGTYFLDGLPAGTYTAPVTPPAGTAVVGPPSRAVTITAAGETRGGLGFQLQRAPTSSSSGKPAGTGSTEGHCVSATERTGIP